MIGSGASVNPFWFPVFGLPRGGAMLVLAAAGHSGLHTVASEGIGDNLRIELPSM
jgi:hypothetical protein